MTPRAEPLKVSVYDNRPMIFLDNRSRPAGLQVDIFNEIAKREDEVSHYQHVSRDMMRLVREILDLGSVVSHLEESNIDIAER